MPSKIFFSLSTLILIFTLFSNSIFSQTRELKNETSEFEQHRRKASELYEKQDWKNYLSELETLLKLASSKEEKINVNSWIAGYYLNQKEYAKAIPHYEEILKLDENNLSAIETLGSIYANDLNVEIKIKKSLPLYLKAEQLGTKNSGTYYDLACIYSIQKELDKSIQYLDKAIYNEYEKIEWIQKDTDLENIRTSEYYNRLINNWEKVKQGKEENTKGIHFYGQGKYEESLKHFISSKEYYQASLGDNSLNVATSYNNLGAVYRTKGEYEKTIEYYSKSLAIMLKILGENHPDVATSNNNLGVVYVAKGEYEKAIECYSKSLAIRLKTLGENHPDVATSYNNFGMVYKSKGEYEKAIEYFSKSLAIYIKTLGENHPDVATSYNNLGGVYYSKGEYEKAIDYYQKAQVINLKTLGDNHPHVASTYNNLGLVYDSKGEYEKAIECFSKSLAIRLKTLGENHPDVAGSYWSIGALYKSKKDYPKSIEYLQKAINIYQKSEERDSYVKVYVTLKEVYILQNKNDMAIHALRQAMELILKFRQEMGQDKTSFTERFLYVFKDLLKLYLDSEQFEKALEVSEKMRGLSISENFNLKYALSQGGVPTDSAQKLLKLKSELESLASERIAAKRMGEKGKQREEVLWKKIHAVEQEANAIDKELISTMPIYAQLRKMESPTITALQKQLKKSGKTFLEYSLFADKDGKEFLHAFVISPKGFESVDLGKDLDITRRVNNLRLIISEYPSRRSFIALKRKDGALVLADYAQCDGFEKGKKCSKFVIDYESKQDDSRNFRMKEVILGFQDHEVDSKESAQLMKQYEKEIYEIVIKPIEEYVDSQSKIIICPDDALFTIPFSALITNDEKYLMEKYSISLIQSATAWMKLQKEEKREYKYPLFAMGNSVYNFGHSDTKGISGQRGLHSANKREIRDLQDLKMNNLPGSLEELKFLSKYVYGKEDFNEHILSGVYANKDQLFKYFSNSPLRDVRNGEGPGVRYKTIHFSVHGLFFSESPELNSLALTSREKALENKKEELISYEEKNGKLEKDGFLKMGDVAELDLKTDLLVMSACETSLGTVQAGEGMVGLPQVFLIGGAKNVLATLWSVDDTGTMLFFKEYYKNLMDKKLHPREALKLTQENLSKESKEIKNDYTDPFYWSPFVVYGE